MCALNYRPWICYLFLLAFLSCTRVDTDPSSSFEQVQETISQLTDQTIYWDSSLEDTIVPISDKELLEKPLTEDLIVQIALLNNPNLQAIYEELGIAKANLAQAGLLKNPIFSFDYEFSTNSSVTDRINLSLLQNILNLLLIPLKKQKASAEVEKAKLWVTTKVLEVIANTKMAFYEFKAKEQTLALQKQILLAAELSYEASQKLFEVGNLKELEMSLKRSFYEQKKLDVASAEIALLKKREELNIQMGLWGRQINWTISSDCLIFPDQVQEFNTVENNAIEQSIDLQIAYQGLIQTAANFGIDTTELVFPSIDLGVSSEREDSIWYVGPALNLALPIFDTGKANAAKAYSTIMKEWNQYTALAIEIRSKARFFRFSLLNAFRQGRYLKQVIIPLVEKVTYESFLQHNAMQLGIFDLIIAKQNELEKKIEYIEKQTEYFLFAIQLQTLLAGHLMGKDHVL